MLDLIFFWEWDVAFDNNIVHEVLPEVINTSFNSNK